MRRTNGIINPLYEGECSHEWLEGFEGKLCRKCLLFIPKTAPDSEDPSIFK
ncbi:MAG: hypothetical protein QXP27_04845 [Candidatus Methanomethyliaceae archaeon]